MSFAEPITTLQQSKWPHHQDMTPQQDGSNKIHQQSSVSAGMKAVVCVSVQEDWVGQG